MKLLLVLIFAFNASGFVSYPKPKGPFQVGVRNDIPVSDFIISIYYPAELPSGSHGVNEPASGLVNSWQGLFDIADDSGKLACGQDNVWWLFSPVAKLFKYGARAGTYFTSVSARPGLPILGNGQKKFPVVLFSHGYASFHAFHLALIQELASHGFIVVAIDHSCRVDEPMNASREFEVRSNALDRRYLCFVGKIPDCAQEGVPWEIYDSEYSQLGKKIISELDYRHVEPRIFEFYRVLDFLNGAHLIDDLFRSMNLTDIGIVGQSRGATAALWVTKQKKFKAVVVLDGRAELAEKIDAEIPVLALFSAGTDIREWVNKTFLNPTSPNIEAKVFM